MNPYFAAEAERYLDRLDALLERPEVDVEELFRLARGVRGSAHMAGSTTVSRVAERLENAAVAVMEKHVAWSAEARRLAAQTVEDMRVLVRALNRWGPAEESRVRTAIERWDDMKAVAEANQGAVASLHRAAGAALTNRIDATPWSTAEGERALREALSLRPLLEEMIHRGGGLDPELARVLDELFGLIRAGIEPAVPAPLPANPVG